MMVEQGIQVKSEVWIPAIKGNERNVYDRAKVISIDDEKKTCVVCLSCDKRSEHVLSLNEVQLTNPRVTADMTSLNRINEAGILHNLKVRSEKDLPYTNMGSVLVSVNPLHSVPDPDLEEGKPFPLDTPHPYAIAENAFKNMIFCFERQKQHQRYIQQKERAGEDVSDEAEIELVVNQSCVISGESGSGKTEASKRVLHHLVNRSSNEVIEADRERQLDRRLYGIGPILEAFGNASTVCNHNSSRFGKFSKLHFIQRSQSGTKGKTWNLVGASVETYLLEQSRVTSHVQGERNFHVFHQLLSCADDDMRHNFGLPTKKEDGILEFNFMQSTSSSSKRLGGSKNAVGKENKRGIGGRRGSSGGGSKRNLLSSPGKTLGSNKNHVAKRDPVVILKTDTSNFKLLKEALHHIGKKDNDIMTLLGSVAGILHIGNIEFKEDVPDQAKHLDEGRSSKALKMSTKLLGLDESELLELLTTREVKAGFETITAALNLEDAVYTRNALAKWTYRTIFDWIVSEINKCLLAGYKEKEEVCDLPFIGVLDIFGFESFAKNGFEQLLINYTNESLQSTFNYQVFVAEADLYKREGLILKDDPFECPTDDGDCLDLIEGTEQKPGILIEIDTVSRGPRPTDDKLNNRLHIAFKGVRSFPRPHPKDMQTTFNIAHYAGIVQYTVGDFVLKNNDSIPSKMGLIMAKSHNPIIKEAFERKTSKNGNKCKGRPIKCKTVVANFSSQINSLIETLESTKCSFIRCVKPNPEMKWARGTNWFNNEYVNEQLKCLSIPQTAAVLKSGFPTRIPYDSLVSAYKSALPEDALNIWRRSAAIATKSEEKSEGVVSDNSKNGRAFCAALFWAFKVPPEAYRLGLTKVFFSSGMIDLLDRIMSEAASWSSKDGSESPEKIEVGKRFKLYYARMSWRRCYAKVISTNAFIRLLEHSRRSGGAARAIQRMVRTFMLRKTIEKRINKRRTRLQQEAELKRKQKEKEEREAAVAAQREAQQKNRGNLSPAQAYVNSIKKKPSLNVDTENHAGSANLPPPGNSFRKQCRSGKKIISSGWGVNQITTPKGSIAPDFIEQLKTQLGDSMAEEKIALQEEKNKLKKELDEIKVTQDNEIDSLREEIALLKKAMPFTHVLHIY